MPREVTFHDAGLRSPVLRALNGRHVYDASELGLSREALDAEYADYRERFLVPREVQSKE
jgi:hypothetical protein